MTTPSDPDNVSTADTPDLPESVNPGATTTGADRREQQRLTPWRTRALWLVAELLVVFLGVYGASLLADWRQEQRDAERRAQAVAALYEQFTSIRSDLQQYTPVFMAFADSFEVRLERGAQPRLVPLNFSSGANTSFWQAILSSSGDVLPVPLISRVELNLIHLLSSTDATERVRDLSDQYIIPRLSDHPEAFYLPGGQLRPEYQWYRQGLSQLQTNLTVIGANLDSLLTVLEAEIE